MSDHGTRPNGPLARFLAGEQLVRARASLPLREGESQPLFASLDVWLTGTGTPAVFAGRAGPSNLLRLGDQNVIVDCGNSTAYRLAELNVDSRDLDFIFITHHHVDHNVDLGFLLMSPWVRKGIYRPPVVVGPPGTVEYVNRVLWAQHYDMFARLPHGYDPTELAVDVLEVEDGMVIPGDGWLCTAFRVDHVPVDEAFGFRFDTGDGSVVISGDTKPSENLLVHARGADVLIHEVIYPGFGFPEYHTVSTEVGKVAARADVGQLVLTHLLPGDLDDEDWLRDARSGFKGPITVGHDLLRVL